MCWSDGNAHRGEISPWFLLAFGLARGSEDFSLRGCAGFENACDACELVRSLLLFFFWFCSLEMLGITGDSFS